MDSALIPTGHARIFLLTALLALPEVVSRMNNHKQTLHFLALSIHSLFELIQQRRQVRYGTVELAAIDRIALAIPTTNIQVTDHLYIERNRMLDPSLVVPASQVPPNRPNQDSYEYGQCVQMLNEYLRNVIENHNTNPTTGRPYCPMPERALGWLDESRQLLDAVVDMRWEYMVSNNLTEDRTHIRMRGIFATLRDTVRDLHAFVNSIVFGLPPPRANAPHNGPAHEHDEL
ncbi:hypothetical protein BCR44DRAFT_372084 [Catenaria anguillulae PL171]|uniref:Uncharacterized protein n=1 Tax=Catenaria anguillulae PL171 TaxID=765915 RepID=A0A1Y2H990_9FUNG|nr:hypothetical protein BCR44DRAFT_372084 [Catenaria anguillulae PL171]